MDNHS
ncbi:putative membrane protein, partial [Chlamydia psittaci 84-8471/1]